MPLAPLQNFRHRDDGRLNLDILLRILRTTVFHYSFGLVAIAMLKAFELPWSHSLVIFFLYYTAFLAAVYGLLGIVRNRRAPLVWQDQVVVITGGSGGIGLCLAEAIAMRGGQVAVLDIQTAHSHLPNIHFYQCDVTDTLQIRQSAERIRERLGAPTLLINNAGIVHRGGILDVDEQAVRQLFAVNIEAHFWTVREFLPDMLRKNQGHIVTISSFLGCIGAAGLTAYSATKGAACLLHDALQHELAVLGSKVCTTLVCPGHVATGMFADVPTANDFLLPVLTPAHLAADIVEAIEAGSSGELRVPYLTLLAPIFRVLPSSLRLLLRKMLGADTATESVLSVQSR